MLRLESLADIDALLRSLAGSGVDTENTSAAYENADLESVRAVLSVPLPFGDPALPAPPASLQKAPRCLS